MKRIYMDHAATTPLDVNVFKAMAPYFSKKYGNASSLHSFGREAKEALEESREKIAKIINAKPKEIYFTSGGTESDNLVVKGILRAAGNGKKVITSAIEHHAILHTVEVMEKEGFNAEYLPVSKEGFVNTVDVERLLDENTALVSVMHANNEIGSMQPIAEIGKLCKEQDVYFHSDAVQSIGKERIDVGKMNLSALIASAHKFYGPKGAGFLYLREGTEIEPLVHGGGHEKGLRSGTENVAGIVGMTKALEIAEKERDKESAKERKMQKRLVKGALQIEDSWLNGPKPGEKRLCNNINLGFDFVEGESIVALLDEKGIAASTGSACSSKSLEPSHVLRAIGLPHVKCHGSLRLSLGRSNTMKDVEYVLTVLPKIISKLRIVSPLRKGVNLAKFEKDIDEVHKH